MNDLNNAIKILKKLMAQGQLDREADEELYLELRNPDVRAILAEFEAELEFEIVEAPRTFYMVPLSGNRILGFKAQDIRKGIATNATLQENYLLAYIIMLIMYFFYGGHNQNPKQRTYIRINSFITELDNRMELALKEPEQTAEQETRYSIEFIKIAEFWQSKQTFEIDKRKTKVGTVLNACRLLEREGLIRILDEDREIRCTKKLDDLMINYYLSDSRVNEINNLFAEGTEKCLKSIG